MSLTDLDYELISAYIDDALAPEERAALETRLELEPELRDELQAIRQVVALVHDLPTLKAPRNFTLTETMIVPQKVVQFPSTGKVTDQRRKPSPVTWVLGIAASLFVAFVCVTTVIAPYLDSLQTDMNTSGNAAGVALIVTATLEAEAIQTSVSATDSATVSAKSSEEMAPPAGTPSIMPALGGDMQFEEQAEFAEESMITEFSAPLDETIFEITTMEAQLRTEGDTFYESPSIASDAAIYESAPSDMDASGNADESVLRSVPAPEVDGESLAQLQFALPDLNPVQGFLIQVVLALLAILTRG